MASAAVDAGDLFGVKGLVAVISGGGTGIGLMYAQALEANGATVYIIGRRKEVLEKAASTAKHGNIRIIQGDVTSKADVERAAAEIKSAEGYINVLIANSGITGPVTGANMPQNPSVTEFVQNVRDCWDEAEFTQTYAVNCMGVFNTITAFLELLDEGNKRGNLKQKSQVIATSSISGFSRMHLTGFGYSSSKAGVIHMMKMFASNLVQFSIRSNVIVPGFYPSEMTTFLEEGNKGKEWPKSVVPEQRFGDGEDMAGAILFLVSRAGAYINGNVLVTDGGRLCVFPSSY